MANVESSSTKHSWTTIDGSKIETPTTFPPYKGIVLGEAQNSAKAIPLAIKDGSALGIDCRIQKASEQINWTNTSVNGVEMNCAKSIEVKKDFDSIQVFVNSTNRTLNDVNYSTNVLKGFVKESLTRIEDVERKVDMGKQSTQESIEELSGKFDKLHIAPKDKPIPVFSLS